jgi:hypothetical protein
VPNLIAGMTVYIHRTETRLAKAHVMTRLWTWYKLDAQAGEISACSVCEDRTESLNNLVQVALDCDGNNLMHQLG